MKIFLAIIGFIVLYFLSTIWYGYVLSIIWDWFIVPAFHIAPLSIALAIGVSIVIRMFTYQYDAQKDKDKSATESLTTGLVASFIYPLVVLGLGWAIHLFI